MNEDRSPNIDDGSRPAILVVDDDRDMCELLSDGLRRRNFEVTWRTNAREALGLAMELPFEAVVTDLNMRDLNGLELCEEIVRSRPNLPVLVITAFGSLESAIAAIRAGAYDFITKPLELDVVALALRRAVQHRALREEVRRLREAVGPGRPHHGLIGESQPMRHLAALVERVAPTQATVLITGESGTGKELVAKAIHRGSGRPGDRFVAVNCAAVPETLIESELFGHVKGAFTDARAERVGLFVEASGGTLFLDEVGELAMATQAKLLRALQERTIRPVGSNREVQVDVRVIAATNRDLETLAADGSFREDLLYRLNVVQLDVPPLRVRGNDILLLAQHFMLDAAARSVKTVKGMSSSVADALLAYRWPGNVRELQNSIERAVILTAHDTLMLDDLPEKVRRAESTKVDAEDPAEFPPMEEVERRYVLRVLDAVGGNRTMAAKILGFDRRTITRKLKAYGISGNDSD